MFPSIATFLQFGNYLYDLNTSHGNHIHQSHIAMLILNLWQLLNQFLQEWSWNI